MITLLAAPDTITFSKNPIIYRFKVTDAIGNAYGPQGQIANLQISTPSFLPGDSLTINWTDDEGVDNSISFNCVASPAGIGDLPASPVTLADYQEIAAKIKAHYRISPFFTVTAIEPSAGFFTISIKSINTAPDWVVAFDNTGLSGSTTIGTEDAIPDNTPDNLEVFMEVFFEQEYLSGTYTQVASLGGTPNGEGEVSFDLKSILDKEVTNALEIQPLPSFDNNTTVKADNLRQYYIRFRLYYDGISEVNGSWNHLGTSYLLCGGISQSLFANTTFIPNISATNSLLTWYPDKKIVSQSQPEYLPWYNYTGADKTIIVQVLRYTATSALPMPAIYRLSNGITIQSYETANIPVGYDALNINDTDVVKYTVRVVDESSDWEVGNPEFLSPVYTFYVDYDYSPFERYLVYMNSFCCPVTIRCLGNMSEAIEIDRNQATRMLNAGYSSQTEERFQYDHELEELTTFRTGFIREDEARVLKEMLAYNRLYEVSEQTYVPLYITEGKFNITASKQNLHAHEIRTKPSLKAGMYSGEVTDMGGYWETTFVNFWRTTFGQKWKLT